MFARAISPIWCTETVSLCCDNVWWCLMIMFTSVRFCRNNCPNMRMLTKRHLEDLSVSCESLIKCENLTSYCSVNQLRNSSLGMFVKSINFVSMWIQHVIKKGVRELCFDYPNCWTSRCCVFPILNQTRK